MSALDPDEIPGVDAYATALVAAARSTGEDPTRLMEARGHYQFAALVALRTFYPLYPASRIGERIGLTKNPLPYLQSAKKAGWWATEGEAAVKAACAALEGI